MTTNKDTKKKDVYQAVTDRLITLLDGNHKWQRPWLSPDVTANGLPTNAAGRHYNGINVPLLWGAAMEFGYSSNLWGTYKQWKDFGAQVRKGEKAETVVFFKPVPLANATPEGDDKESFYFLARAFSVFNAAQVDGYDHPPMERPADAPIIERIAAAESTVSNTGADIRFGGTQAAYHRTLDYIQLPEINDFISTECATAQENYYSTLFHELAHWAGSTDRLNRTKGKRFGDDAYAIEELCAEISSSFTCAMLGITPVAKPESAAYIKHWLAALRSDKKWFFQAASAAQKATDFILFNDPKHQAKIAA